MKRIIGFIYLQHIINNLIYNFIVICFLKQIVYKNITILLILIHFYINIQFILILYLLIIILKKFNKQYYIKIKLFMKIFSQYLHILLKNIHINNDL